MISNIGVLVTIFILNKYLFVYAVIVALCIFAITKRELSKCYQINKEVKKLHEKKTAMTSELVRGIRDIKVLNASQNILRQTTRKIEENSNEEVKMLKVRRIYSAISNYTEAITDFIFIVLGCFLYKNSLLTIPTFVIIYNYQGKIKNLLIGINQILEYNKKFTLASDRIYEVIDNNKFQKETFGHTKVTKLNGHIKFSDVDFQYQASTPILKHINFEINPNEKVAFVGKSGVGKTTIFNLIAKLYHRESGEILIDNYSIDELDEKSLRNNMSIITQNPYIFNFSIKDNLLLAKANATMKEIRSCCSLACLDDYIMSLPDKYDTMVGENGVILSGGQKQRLAIARALLMKTEIIMFDEATSALDNTTQSEISTAINNLKGEYTILIVAHRLSTIIDCDRIFVIDDGRVIASGSHQELLKTCSFYQELYSKDLQI